MFVQLTGYGIAPEAIERAFASIIEWRKMTTGQEAPWQIGFILPSKSTDYQKKPAIKIRRNL